MVKISVIIPVYNVEKYIEEALNSILNQTLIDDIEVIMVDDGSTDNSRYIIERYALDYPNFHAYHKENEGQGIARNYGLKLAKGDYIHFFDSDDYIPKDYYEKLYDVAVKNDCDIVASNVYRFGRYNISDTILFKHSFSEFDKDMDGMVLDEYPSLIWDTAIWNKLYRTSFLKSNELVYLDKKILYEDLLFALSTYTAAESISFIKNTYYFWRLRNNHTSVTQNSDNIKSFEDRLEILNLRKELLEQYNPDLLWYEYYKWANHDLKVHLRKFNHFPENYHNILIEDTLKIIKLIPEDVIDKSTSYVKILFEMIKNKDTESLLNFAHLEKELYKTKNYKFNIPDNYLELTDFDKDFKNENLKATVLNIDKSDDGENLIIDFEEYVRYDFNDHQVTAELVCDNKQHLLEITNNSQIIVPSNLIKENSHSKIKITHITGDISKESYLRNNKRQNFTFDDFDIDVGIGINSQLYLEYLIKNENEVVINDIEFIDNNFIFKGESKNPIKNMLMTNVVSFEEKNYPVDYQNDEFKFIIPHDDILGFVVKKWELNCPDAFNSLQLSEKFELYEDFSKIIIYNRRNKIIIADDVSKPQEEIYNKNEKIAKVWEKHDNLKIKYKDVKKQNRQLRKDKKKLTKNNTKLESKVENLENRNKILHEIIEEYKSRKVIKIADKLKSLKG